MQHCLNCSVKTQNISRPYAGVDPSTFGGTFSSMRDPVSHLPAADASGLNACVSALRSSEDAFRSTRQYAASEYFLSKLERGVAFVLVP